MAMENELGELIDTLDVFLDKIVETDAEAHKKLSPEGQMMYSLIFLDNKYSNFRTLFLETQDKKMFTDEIRKKIYDTFMEVGKKIDNINKILENQIDGE